MDCPGDFDGNGIMNDVLVALGDFGCSGVCVADLDGDGIVGVTDIPNMLFDWPRSEHQVLHDPDSTQKQDHEQDDRHVKGNRRQKLNDTNRAASTNGAGTGPGAEREPVGPPRQDVSNDVGEDSRAIGTPLTGISRWVTAASPIVSKAHPRTE